MFNSDKLRIISMSKQEKFFLVYRLECYIKSYQKDIDENNVAKREFLSLEQKLLKDRTSVFLGYMTTDPNPDWKKYNIKRKIIRDCEKSSLKTVVNKYYKNFYTTFKNQGSSDNCFEYSEKYISLMYKFMTNYINFSYLLFDRSIKYSINMVNDLENIVKQNGMEEDILEILNNCENNKYLKHYKENIYHTISKNNNDFLDKGDIIGFNKENGICYHIHPEKRFNDFLEIFSSLHMITNNFDLDKICTKLSRSEYFKNFQNIISSDENIFNDINWIINNMIMKLLFDINIPFSQLIENKYVINQECQRSQGSFHSQVVASGDLEYIDKNNIKHIVFDTLKIFLIEISLSMSDTNINLYSFIVDKILSFFTDYCDSEKIQPFLQYLIDSPELLHKEKYFIGVISSYYHILSTIRTRMLEISPEFVLTDFDEKLDIIKQLYKNANKISGESSTRIKKKGYILEKIKDLDQCFDLEFLFTQKYTNIDDIVEILKSVSIIGLETFIRSLKDDVNIKKILKKLKKREIYSLKMLKLSMENESILHGKYKLRQKVIDIISSSIKIREVSEIIFEKHDPKVDLNKVDIYETHIPAGTHVLIDSSKSVSNLDTLIKKKKDLEEEIELLELQGESPRSDVTEELENICNLIDYEKYEMKDDTDIIHKLFDKMNYLKKRIELCDNVMKCNKYKRSLEKVSDQFYMEIQKIPNMERTDKLVYYRPYDNDDEKTFFNRGNIDYEFVKKLEEHDKMLKKEEKINEANDFFEFQKIVKRKVIDNCLEQLGNIFDIEPYDGFIEHMMGIYINKNNGYRKTSYACDQVNMFVKRNLFISPSTSDYEEYNIQVSNDLMIVITILNFITSHELIEIRDDYNISSEIAEDLIGKDIDINGKFATIFKHDENFFYAKSWESHNEKIIKIGINEEIIPKYDYCGKTIKITKGTRKGIIGKIIKPVNAFNDDRFLITPHTGGAGRNVNLYEYGNVDVVIISKSDFVILPQDMEDIPGKKSSTIPHRGNDLDELRVMLDENRYNLYTITRYLYNKLGKMHRMGMKFKSKDFNYFNNLYEMSLNIYNRFITWKNKSYVNELLYKKNIKELKCQLEVTDGDFTNELKSKRNLQNMIDKYEQLQKYNELNYINYERTTLSYIEDEQYDFQTRLKNYERIDNVMILEENCSFRYICYSDEKNKDHEFIEEKTEDEDKFLNAKRERKKMLLKSSRKTFKNFDKLVKIYGLVTTDLES